MDKIFKKVYNGNNHDGPSILIIGGIHGDEITPLKSIIHFMEQNCPNELSEYFSRLCVINGVNISALRSGTREIKSEESKDLNRCFDSGPNFDPVEYMKTAIGEYNLIIDIHSSPNIADFVLIDIDEKADGYVDWCNDAGVLYGARYSSANTVKRYALNKGYTAITLELNGMHIPDNKSAKRGVEILKSLIKSFKPLSEKKPDVESMIDVKTYKEGLLIFSKDLGARVNKGEEIGYITNLGGERLLDIKAPVNGVILGGPDDSYYIKAGSNVCLIQPC